MTPKSPEQIMGELNTLIADRIRVVMDGFEKGDVHAHIARSTEATKRENDWLRQALQSVILFAAKEAKKKIPQRSLEADRYWNFVADQYYAALKDFAQKIV